MGDEARKQFLEQGEVAPGDEAMYESLKWSETDNNGRRVFHFQKKRGTTIDWASPPEEFTPDLVRPLRASDLERLSDPQTELTQRQRDSFAESVRVIENERRQRLVEAGDRMRDRILQTSAFKHFGEDLRKQLARDLGLSKWSDPDGRPASILDGEVSVIKKANARLESPRLDVEPRTQGSPRDAGEVEYELDAALEDAAERQSATEARDKAVADATLKLASLANIQHVENQRLRVTTTLLSFAVVFGVIYQMLTADHWLLPFGGACLAISLLLLAHLGGQILLPGEQVKPSADGEDGTP